MRRALPLMALMASAVPGLAACGGGTPVVPTGAGAATSRHSAVVIVTGDRNSPQAITTPSIIGLLQRAVDDHSGFALVDAGGRPRLFSTTLGARMGNADALQAAQAQQLSGAAQAIGRIAPTVPQTDPWDALVEGLDWLQAQGGGTAVFENSGLGTAGFLNYLQPGMLQAEPAQVVQFARSHEELPDAKGLTVVLLGLGWTAAPQGTLDAPDRANIIAQWTALLRASGATVRVDPTPLTGPGLTSSPSVSVIRARSVAWQSPPDTCGEVLSSTAVHFAVGTAELTNPSAAVTALGAVVHELRANHRVATIIGTTSSEGGPAINGPLSALRATTIARTMRSMGLPAPQIGRIVGLGTNFPGFVPDTGAGGTLLPGPAAMDRQTIVSWPCARGEPRIRSAS